MLSASPGPSDTGFRWVRIPNGTKVRHRFESYDGMIDGLTELVSGPQRNPDGRTQYRVNVGDSTRLLVAEDNLNILLDESNLAILDRQNNEYRRLITARLRSAFAEDRFVSTESIKEPGSAAM